MARAVDLRAWLIPVGVRMGLPHCSHIVLCAISRSSSHVPGERGWKIFNQSTKVN